MSSQNAYVRYMQKAVCQLQGCLIANRIMVVYILCKICIVHRVKPVLSTFVLLNIGYLILLREKYITSCAYGYNFYSVVKVLHVLEMPTCI